MSITNKLEKKKHQEILDYLGNRPMFTSEVVVFNDLGYPNFTGNVYIYLNKQDFEAQTGIKFAEGKILKLRMSNAGIVMNLVKTKQDKRRALKMASRAGTLGAFLKRFRSWQNG